MTDTLIPEAAERGDYGSCDACSGWLRSIGASGGRVSDGAPKSGILSSDDHAAGEIDSHVNPPVTTTEERSILLWGWALILLLGAIDWYWADRKGWAFYGWLDPVTALTFLLSIGLFYGLSGRDHRLADAGHYGALWIAFSVVGSVFTYLTATLGMPLRDAELSRLDAAFGFDWFAWSTFVAAHRPLRFVLEIAYGTFLPQIIGSILYFAHTRRGDRNGELLCAGMVSLIITAVIAGFVPALAPYFPGPPDACTVALIGLREGAVARFVLGDLQGIIAIPSFHTIVALLLIYAHRPLARSFYPVLLLNVLMVISTPSQGHHYLVDIIAGIMVAVLSIATVRVVRKAGTQKPGHRPIPEQMLAANGSRESSGQNRTSWAGENPAQPSRRRAS